METRNVKDGILKALSTNLNELGCIKGENAALNCAILSSGCKLNQFESSQFGELLKQLKINIVEPDLTARDINLSRNPNAKINLQDIQLFFLNTCSVTEKADAYANKIVRRIRENYPQSRLILTGCSAELNKKGFSSLSNVKLIDNAEKARLLKTASETLPDTVLNQKKVRPYLKIQEGCGTECSFCIIPKARPVKWSLDVEDVLNSIKGFDNLGYKEVILTGVNIGSYKDENIAGKDKKGKGLKELLKRIEELNTALKIRISSIDPLYIDDELIEIFANSKKIQNHFHIPLQSASNKILALMNRHYSFEDYMKIASELTGSIKGAAIGTDIISGFPGETEEDFLETSRNLDRLPIYYIHAFSYSDRPGTRASLMKPKVDRRIIKQRTNKIMEISLQKKINFHLKFTDIPLEFLSLPDNKAVSSNYIKAKLVQNNLIIPPGKLFKGKIIETGDLHTKGEALIAFENFI
ncbi:MAG: MiaB/RimO family radical SAM methylthiotransferase [Deltaproteobacteria bacterium]|nr:MiaB/RimO family radical SAM methylthiotransferase [Deltaproteobacteria bacterium]